jgi:hypothetical protein
MSRLVICAVLCLFLYTSARADTFTLTSGSITVSLNSVSIGVSGPNVSIGIGVAPGFGVDFTNVSCIPAPCQGGSTLHVGGLFAFLGDNNFPGTATINGVTFNNLDLAVALQSTSEIILPPNFGGNGPVNLPFSMTGTLTGFTPCPQVPIDPGCRIQVFSIMVNGSGIVTAESIIQPHPSVTFNFQPVPEPATLGLLGIGVLALQSFYRSRKKL